jgi:hypothetical protein
MTIFQTIKELRHSGKPVEAWNTGYPALRDDPGNLFLKRSLYWACYDGIKAIQEPIVHRKNKAPIQQEQQDIASWISCIEKLDLPMPCEELDFRFFNLFRENGEHYEAFVRFVINHSENLFVWPDDFTPYQGEKHESPSQVVKQARTAAKGWLIHRKEWDIDLAVLLLFLDMADSKAKDHDKTWLHYDYAKCLIASRNYEAARDLVLPIVRSKVSEFWAWGALADTYIDSNPTKAISCFAKGLSECREVKFSVKMRRRLVSLLASQGEFDKASALLCSIIDIYASEGWALNPEDEELIAQPWFNASAAGKVNFDKFFSTTGAQANNLLYDNITTKTGVVSSIHKSGKGFNVYLSEDLKIPVRKGIYVTKALPSVGDWVSVTYANTSDSTEVLEAGPTDAITLPGVEAEVGELRVNPKGFAFVGNTFVAPDLVVQELHGAEVEVLKIWDMNPKKKEMAWRAIKVTKLAI